MKDILYCNCEVVDQELEKSETSWYCINCGRAVEYEAEEFGEDDYQLTNIYG